MEKRSELCGFHTRCPPKCFPILGSNSETIFHSKLFSTTFEFQWLPGYYYVQILGRYPSKQLFLAWNKIKISDNACCSLCLYIKCSCMCVYKCISSMFLLLLLLGCWKAESSTCSSILWWVWDSRAAAVEWGSGQHKGQQVAHSSSSCLLFQKWCMLQQIVLLCFKYLDVCNYLLFFCLPLTAFCQSNDRFAVNT